MSHPATTAIDLRDHHPAADNMITEVLQGLRGFPKMISSRYLYDDRGAELFEEISQLVEYYPTRTELGILQRNIDEIAALLGPHCLLIEYGSGPGRKTRLLLRHLEEPVAYVPVDISREQLINTAEEMAEVVPDMQVIPVCADYTRPFPLPDIDRATRRNIVFFPGSTIGNFTPDVARDFLSQIASICRPRGALLIGVDLKKDRRVIEAAYNDRRGTTALFNLNLLDHLNREIGSDFDALAFRHHALYKEEEGRVEMHLISERDQTVHIDDTTVEIREGESIVTEYSYKYGRDEFEALAESAGLSVDRVWVDEGRLFSVQYLRPD